MRVYRVTANAYSEVGAETNDKIIRYFDNVEEAKNFYKEYDAMKQENGQKAYKMRLAVLGYINVESPTDFFNQFEA